MIEAGSVSVDGRPVTERGVCIDPASQVVEVEGRRVEPQRKIVIMLNKPRDVLCTSSDPRGRRTFHSLLPPMRERVFTVGRLDRDSEGLLLATNDGDLAFALTHPSREVEKVYLVWLEKRLTEAQEREAREGVRVGDEILRVAGIEYMEKARGGFMYKIRLREGRNRHIRRLFAAEGVGVARLKRIQLGALKLDDMRPGAWRYLRNDEIETLRDSVIWRSGKGGAR